MRKVAYTSFSGGENLRAPALTINPGELLFSQNYEPDAKGKYRRIDGLERFDGRPKPSEASYWVLDFDTGSVEPAVDDIIRGNTSGASGILIAVSVSSGTWGGGDAAGYLVIYNLSGTFVNDEVLENLGSTGASFDSGFASGFA